MSSLHVTIKFTPNALPYSALPCLYVGSAPLTFSSINAAKNLSTCQNNGDTVAAFLKKEVNRKHHPTSVMKVLNHDHRTARTELHLSSPLIQLFLKLLLLYENI